MCYRLPLYLLSARSIAKTSIYHSLSLQHHFVTDGRDRDMLQLDRVAEDVKLGFGTVYG